MGDGLIVAAWLAVLGHNVGLALRGVGRPLGAPRAAAAAALVVALVVAGVHLERTSGGPLAVPAPLIALGVATALGGALLHVVARRRLGTAWSASAERPAVLVEDGAYARVRHPLYLGLGLLALGTMLAHPSLPTVAGGLGLLAGLARKTAREERALAATFGTRWERYRARVPLVLPRRQRG